MENSRSNKFKTKFEFVKPLYRKNKINVRDNTNRSTRPVNFDSNVKRFGDDFNVKTVVTKGANVINIKRNISKEYKVLLPGACGSEIHVQDLQNCKNLDKTLKNQIIDGDKCKSDMKMNSNDANSDSNINFTNSKERSKFSQANLNGTIVYHKMPDTWLRVYPDKKLPGENLYSIILRCFLCQLGLGTFLILWTIVAVFVIQSYEGPQEIQVSLQFEKEQNQLVIDLATELRQVFIENNI
ncbi:unnamed protein product [Euphydryas editha]|uniref:Uncharacterized protein n=1 Tax=Euphydryas editha TaxID=104508 RepID=A0AAU9TU19_EUPED|nr:unnamed protein product [Euphydryas editha]